MTRKGKVPTGPVVIALCCAVAGVGLAGCGGSSDSDSGSDSGSDTSARHASADPADRPDGRSLLTGTKKIKVDGRSVNVSCSGSSTPKNGRPVVVLMHGGGDSLKKLADLQKTLSTKDRVCSYDRLGAGGSDKPDGTQTLNDTGKLLTGVLDRVAGDAPVVLAGHSLGGLMAARYAPDHQDRVKGLVMLDATSPTQIEDLNKGIPASTKGPAAQLRAQTLAVFRGGKPERLKIRDGKVRSAGDIPVEVIRHGKKYLATLPKYGPGLERAWAEGQRKWLAVSSRSHLSTAKKSEHYIYLDEPEVAVRAIQSVASRVAGHR